MLRQLLRHFKHLLEPSKLNRNHLAALFHFELLAKEADGVVQELEVAVGEEVKRSVLNLLAEEFALF